MDTIDTMAFSMSIPVTALQGLDLEGRCLWNPIGMHAAYAYVCCCSPVMSGVRGVWAGGHERPHLHLCSGDQAFIKLVPRAARAAHTLTR